jgi:serralysin
MFGVARHNTDGTLETTFGGDGKVTTDFTRYDDSAAAVAIAPDGAIVVAGVSGIGGRYAKIAVARYRAP